MNQPECHGIDRQGVGEPIASEEARKSDLLMEVQLLCSQGQGEAAAAKLAEAATMEERLSGLCLNAGLRDKAWVHQLSAASCWAQAGNFYRAISLCDELLAQPDLPKRFRDRVFSYADRLRSRRAQWYAELQLTTAGA